ncbi:MAG TPA: hypothetical protein VHZ24_09770 [Pirellulales bacterium]|jgi:hypothetical protein|nr:hypothetical protein [Pirellulales bacterium]
MRLILSRKGFDSGVGGCASPILPDGTMLSLPIPDQSGKITYGEMKPRGLDIAMLVSDLSKTATEQSTAHLDPDLDRTTLSRSRRWRPAFGQSRAAASHLKNQNVDCGDLFLFFGWFRRVERPNARWRFVRQAPDLHVLFGWLWVDEVIREFPSPAPPGLERHPHFDPNFPHGNRPNSVVYIGKPGRGGIFPKFADELQLSAGGPKRSLWRLPIDFHACRLSYHPDPARWSKGNGCCNLRVVDKGQEFVVDCTPHPSIRAWAEKLISKHGSA